MTRNHSSLLETLSEEYARHAPRSLHVHQRATTYLVDGISHPARSLQPFPPAIAHAQGAWLTDEDDHRILDFWQGHYANILGHNPPAIVDAVTEAMAQARGLQGGFTSRSEQEAAELLCQQTGADKCRFTTSGALATMWAAILAQAHTNRHLVLKVGGGWHGGHPWALRGVYYSPDHGYQGVESNGLPDDVSERVLVTSFNDTEMLEECFRNNGDEIACFIVEPFIGMGGMLPASVEFLQAARTLTQQHGALLIFDEVISGFRLRAGDAGALYGIQPDLAIFGKIIGGGMPLAALTGSEQIMALTSRRAGNRVRFSGGTFSAHPGALAAMLAMMQYLVDQEEIIYPHLSALGEHTRLTIEHAFQSEGIRTICTGRSPDTLSGSSLGFTIFPTDEDWRPDCPEDVWDPSRSDVTLRETVLRLALLLEGVHVVHGLGAVSAAHTVDDIEFLGECCQRVASRLRTYFERPGG